MSEIRDAINKASLTKTQTVISQYVLDNSADVCFMTSTDIARELGVSESSVVRFSRALGFAGYSDFQKCLRRDYQDRVSSISSAITNPAQRMVKRTQLETDPNYIKRHFKNAIRNLETVFTANTIASFEKAANAIVKSRHKYIIASRGNTCLGDYFFLYMKQMLPNVESTVASPVSPLDHLCSIRREDCVIAFSFPRYSKTDRLAVQMAKDAGAAVIVITDKPSADLAAFADCLLTVPVDSNTFFNSLVGAQFVTEALLDTISHKVQGIEKRLKYIDRYLNETGNY